MRLAFTQASRLTVVGAILTALLLLLTSLPALSDYEPPSGIGKPERTGGTGTR